jgi:hypothetical protein
MIRHGAADDVEVGVAEAQMPLQQPVPTKVVTLALLITTKEFSVVSNLKTSPLLSTRKMSFFAGPHTWFSCAPLAGEMFIPANVAGMPGLPL